ncbi:MAG: site-specific integrase [Actinomycetota bacterium]
MRGRGSIVQQSPKTWRIAAWTPAAPTTGQRQRIQRTVSGSKKDAQRALTKLVSDIDRGLIASDPSRLTVAQFMGQWLAHMRHRIRATTFDRYEGVTQNHIIPQLGKTQIGKLKPMQIQAFEARLLESGRMRKQGGLSAQTVLHIHRVFSEALGQAVRWQLLAVNPALAVQPPRTKRPELKIPDAETVERIVATARATSVYIAVLLAASTGMRRGEILGLRWSEVDLDRGIIRVVSTYQRSRRGLEFADPKTDRARRAIAVPQFAVEVLRQHHRRQTTRRLRAGRAWHDFNLVVELGDGRPVDPSEFTRKFAAIATKAGAKGVRLHDMRHAFATMLLTSGVHPKIASEALGHSTVGITLDTYSHVLPNMQAEAAAAIQEALGQLVEPRTPPGQPSNVYQLKLSKRP